MTLKDSNQKGHRVFHRAPETMQHLLGGYLLASLSLVSLKIQLSVLVPLPHG